MHTPNPTVFSKTRSLGFTAWPHCFARRSAAEVDNAWNKRSSTITANALMFEPGACFAAGTLVHTKEGLNPIEQIQIGDWVLSQPENGGEQAYKRVLKTFAHAPERIVEVRYTVPSKDLSREARTGFRVMSTLNHPFWTKEEGWTAPGHMQHNGIGAFHFQGKGGDDIEFWSIKNIYRSDQPNVGWTSNSKPESMRGYGSLWDYEGHRLVAPEAYALEDISWGEHPDPYFKAPVYNLEVEDFHTYYVGEHGIWVHNQNCNGQSFGAINTTKVVALNAGTEHQRSPRQTMALRRSA